jgi:hypothetical protein
MHLGESIDHPWQVALQVNSKGQKVRNHQDVPYAAIRQARHGFVQAGLRLEKCHLDLG